MKTRLLKRLRNIGRGMVNVNSVTRVGDTVVGMQYGYDEDYHRGLFSCGDTEQDVKDKAASAYIKNNIERIRKRYSKFSKNKGQ